MTVAEPTLDPGRAPDKAQAKARPFLKWAGGKRSLLDAITPLVPPRYGTYFEPFLGGGALFFHLRPRRARLSDGNERLVRTYLGVRDRALDVIHRLRSYPHTRATFEQMRAVDVDAAGDDEVAAWFIYLNKTAFNGLYRVNRGNRFNVPFGAYRNPTICDEANLLACARALRRAELASGDFADAVTAAVAGDFVYFDPPYVPVSSTASFTSYTARGFTEDDQRRLRDLARSLKRRGVHVLLSNSDTPAVRALYARGFKLTPVTVARPVSARVAGRAKVGELLIR